MNDPSQLRTEFIRFAVETGVLKFGQFTLKSGRVSPYFFNAGLFNDGVSLQKLCEFYARTIVASGIQFDVLFGPAYKGITLAAGTAIELTRLAVNTPYAYNRKEAKDHGEGGVIVGAPLVGRVLIIDDVISAGTSVRESVQMIESAGAKPCGVVIALDRMEKGQKDGPAGSGTLSELSAVQEVNQAYGLPVLSIAGLNDVLGYLEGSERSVAGDVQLLESQAAVKLYRTKYGVTG